MTNWSFDILRQGGWDLWLLVCCVAAAVLLAYAVLGRLWQRPFGWIALLLIAIGVGGTAAVAATPQLHHPFIGLGWTFLLLCILSATFYFNLHPQLGTRRTLALLAVRIVALALLVPMLFEPVARVITKPRPEKSLIFLFDTSGSMSFPDVQNGPTRIQSVWQTLRPQLPRIQDHFLPHYYTFATDVQELKKADELGKINADGKATDIAKAVQKILPQSVTKDSAIVLISDGIDNTSPNVAEALRGLMCPIHTVRVGSEQAEPSALANVAVDNVEAADDFVVNHETKVKATIKSTALANRVVEVKMSEVDSGAPPARAVGQIVSKTLVLQPVPEGQTVELPFKPKTVGVQRLAVWIDPIAGERSTVDNRQEFQGLALDPRIKVLYVEGRVRPEYTQLHRALQRDSNIEVASLLRIQADRFAAAGTVDGEAIAKLPASAEDWKKFDVVILGDMDASFLTKLQQAQIEQFCFKGGGVLMIGGQNNFGPGGYKDSAIEKALPVFAGDTNSPQERSPFVPQLTEEGTTHPAMEGLAEWFSAVSQKSKIENQNSLPPLRGNVVVPRPKSGAQVLLIHADRPGPDGKPQIILAVQRYGEGRSAAFTADTTYLWYLPLRGMGQDSPYNRFWGQLIRWLANSDTRNRQRNAGVDGLLNKSMYQLGESVRVRAMVRDERGDATRYARVSLKLTRPGGGTQLVPLNPVETRTGLYSAAIANPDKGDWTIELSAMKDDKPLGKQTLKFTVIPPAEEMLKLAANPQLLRAISEQTRGFHYELAQLPNLIDQLIRAGQSSAAARQETIPLANTLRLLLSLVQHYPAWPAKYDLPMQGMLVLLLLAAEWLLRRKWQLP